MSTKFIVFEGLDGSGKSTQVDLVCEKLLKMDIPVFFTHEPDYESPTGSLIKQLLENKDIKSEYGFQLLYCADRGFHEEKIKEELKTKWVICDRYFYSTLAYILNSNSGNKYFNALKIVSDEFIKPDLSIFIDYPADKCIEQINKSRNGFTDFFEKVEKLEKIRQAYINIANQYNLHILERKEKTKEELNKEIMDLIISKLM